VNRAVEIRVDIAEHEECRGHVVLLRPDGLEGGGGGLRVQRPRLGIAVFVKCPVIDSLCGYRIGPRPRLSSKAFPPSWP
jgi:hypothetical protein